jgi:hypothetical protein
VDGATLVSGAPADTRVGDLVRARVTGTAGVDLAVAYVQTVDAVAEVGTSAAARPVVAAGR